MKEYLKKTVTNVFEFISQPVFYCRLLTLFFSFIIVVLMESVCSYCSSPECLVYRSSIGLVWLGFLSLTGFLELLDMLIDFDQFNLFIKISFRAIRCLTYDIFNILSVILFFKRGVAEDGPNYTRSMLTIIAVFSIAILGSVNDYLSIYNKIRHTKITMPSDICKNIICAGSCVLSLGSTAYFLSVPVDPINWMCLQLCLLANACGTSVYIRELSQEPASRLRWNIRVCLVGAYLVIPLFKEKILATYFNLATKFNNDTDIFISYSIYVAFIFRGMKELLLSFFYIGEDIENKTTTF